jgi:hypothetical protein
MQKTTQSRNDQTWGNPAGRERGTGGNPWIRPVGEQRPAFVRFGLRSWENGDWFDADSAFLFP